MARTFRGESRNKVDGKGRVSIPASFRRVLEGSDPDWKEGLQPQMVIVYGLPRHKYLECFSMDAIAEVDARIANLPRGSKNRRTLETIYNGMSDTVSVDDTGRFVLPQKARAKLKLTDEAQFIATGDTFQIWHPKDYEAEVLEGAEALLDEFDEDFHPLLLLEEAPTRPGKPEPAEED